MIQNTVAQLIFNKPNKAHITPLFISAPSYPHSLLQEAYGW